MSYPLLVAISYSKVWILSLYHVLNAWALRCAVGRKKIRIEKISDERNRQVAHSRLHAQCCPMPYYLQHPCSGINLQPTPALPRSMSALDI